MRTSTPQLAVLALALGLACTPPPPMKVCVPGKTETCACPGGLQGAQACAADGLGFEACVCPTVGGGSAGTGGGSGGGQASAGGAAGGAVAGGVSAGGAAGGIAGGASAGGLAGGAAGGATADAGVDGGTGCDLTGCGAHGACTLGVCVCEQGYTGMTCTSCASGYQDNDSNGSCVAGCGLVDAGCVRGACTDSSGAVSCSCTGGFTGPTCAACPAGQQDNDNNGQCAPSCTSATCSGHGTCADTTGTATCTCTGGFTLPTCATCAPGQQDNDNNGQCSAGCDAGTLSCTGPTVCGDATGTASCGCMRGYQASGTIFDAGVLCTWSGVVTDPDFRATTPAWTTLGQATLNPFLGTALGVGAAVCPDGGSCTDTSVAPGVRQVVSMPQATNTLAFALTGRVAQATAVRVGNGLVGLPPGTSSQCLGESAFGANQPLTALSWMGALRAPYAFTIDFLDVVPEPRCPLPGAVLNGSFESTAVNGITGYLGWTSQSLSLQIATVGVVNGSRAGRLATTACAPGVWVQTQVSVPAQMVNPAVQFQARRIAGNTAECRVAVRTKELLLGGDVVPTMGATTVCLGSWTRGQTIPVAFSSFVATQMPVPCLSLLAANEVQLDDVVLVDEPSCAPVVPDSTFEGPDAGSGWQASAPITSTFLPGGAALAGVTFPRGPDAGHDSSGSAQVMTRMACGATSLERTVVAPALDGGVAVRFWYRTDGPSRVWLSPWTADGGRSEELSPTSAWTPYTLCVPRGLEGLPFQLRFSTDDFGFGSACSPFGGTVTTLDIDDVQVAASPNCVSGASNPGACSLAQQDCPMGQACMRNDVMQPTAACFAGPCSLVGQDCGPGNRCDYTQQSDAGLARACLPTGANLAEGAVCDRATALCAPGLTCLPLVDGGSTCWKYCNTDAECGAKRCSVLVPFGSSREVASLCY